MEHSNVMSALLDLASEASANGWASGSGEIGVLFAAARAAGWRTVPIRSGESEITTLRPVPAEQAHPNSLSAMVGLGRQPFHTDGAHLRRMPDIVILASETPSDTPTLLCDPTPPTDAQLQGVFRVAGGRDTFYATAVNADGTWRYDPGCMTPADEHARRAADDFENLVSKTVRHEWTEPNTLLVIANRRILHARAEAVDSATRRVHRVAFITGLET